MLRAVLVDDEALALKNLKYVLTQLEEIKVMAALTSPFAALEKISGEKPDVVFLDIEMPGLNGLEAAEEIWRISEEILIVFVTAYDEYAVKAFEVNALDYLLKPVTLERLERTLEKVKRTYHHSLTSLDSRKSSRSLKALKSAGNLLDLYFDKIIAWQNDRIFVFKLDQALYFTMEKGEAFVITEKGGYRVKGTLNYWEERLADAGFFRCHKGFLVNMDKISMILPMFNNTFSLRLTNYEKEIPVSRRYAVKLKRIIHI
ncbi:MAG: LytR/AlgR family response regulator transcription factor [Bacillota bacterium]|jgi:DNA-binding LytR/AlgR family response regulator